MVRGFDPSRKKSLSPTKAAVDEKSSILPWIAPTFFEPYRSAWYAGRMAYTPPKIDIANAVVPQKAYRGTTPPVVTTASTMVGTAK